VLVLSVVHFLQVSHQLLFFPTSGRCYDVFLCMFVFPLACWFFSLSYHWYIFPLVISTLFLSLSLRFVTFPSLSQAYLLRLSQQLHSPTTQFTSSRGKLLACPLRLHNAQSLVFPTVHCVVTSLSPQPRPLGLHSAQFLCWACLARTVHCAVPGLSLPLWLLILHNA